VEYPTVLSASTRATIRVPTVKLKGADVSVVVERVQVLPDITPADVPSQALVVVNVEPSDCRNFIR
jgi:hypothetical protein